MGQIAVVESVTLDGVMQGLGAPEEDTRGGFAHGGWGAPYMDEVMGREMGKGMDDGAAEGGAMLFGRRTYDQFATYWPFRPADDPFAAHMNATTKYVVTSARGEALPWAGSQAIAFDEVAALRARAGSLSVIGSGELVRGLLTAGLVDVLTLLIHPLLLGTGRRLFGDGELSRLELVSSVPTTTGVIIATYRPAV